MAETCNNFLFYFFLIFNFKFLFLGKRVTAYKGPFKMEMNGYK
jgi:hypothetical protein